MALPTAVHIGDTRPEKHPDGSDVGNDWSERAIDVAVGDERGHVDPALRELAVIRAPQEAVETAGVPGWYRRSGRATATVPCGGTDGLEHDDDTTQTI